MNRVVRELPVYALILTFVLAVRGQAVPSDVPNPKSAGGVEFIVKAFDQFPIIAVADLPACDEFHQFLRTLVRSPAFRQKVHYIIVDFGNPLLQSVLDRYLLQGELMPNSVLRHVWDDTTESPDLTWDSPLYAEFFDAIRAVNLGLSKEQRLRVTVADAPISWRKIQTKEQWLTLRGQPREDALATAVEDVLGQNERAFVISAGAHLYQNSGFASNARALIEKHAPGKLFLVLPQARFGAGDSYKEVERREQAVPPGSITLLRNTWIGARPIAGAPDSPRLEDVADAVLYLGNTGRLTEMQPNALLFRDEEFWTELNRRWKLIHGIPFDLKKAGFDLRGPYIWPPPQMGISTRPTSSVAINNAIDFVLEKLGQYPIVGIGDLHMCLQYSQFLQQLIEDPRLPDKVQDIVVEVGNPLYQSVVDRYVFEGKEVPLAVRRHVWQEAAGGWYVANSPIYEAFYDQLRAVNLKLPQKKRLRVVLGDAPLDVGQFRANPDQYFRPFLAFNETLQDPREISIAASMTREIASGRRALVLSGNGHLNFTQRTGNARHIFERSYPNQFYLIDESGDRGNPSWPTPSIVTWADDREPNHAMLWLGPLDSLTVVRASPLIYRDTAYWTFINLMEKVKGRDPIDLASASFEYRMRYPWTQ